MCELSAVMIVVLVTLLVGVDRRQERPGRLAGALYVVLACVLALLLGVTGVDLAGDVFRELDDVGRAIVLFVVGALLAGVGVWLQRRRFVARDHWSTSVPVDRWRKAGLGVKPIQGTVEFGEGQVCPLCRLEHQPTSDAAECPACKALFHLPCAIELGRCSTLGCAGAPVRVAAVAEGRADVRERLRARGQSHEEAS